MSKSRAQDRQRRTLTRERIVDAAIRHADEEGVASLTIRGLAARIGVKPMSLYYHVASKQELFEAMTTAVLAELDLPDPGVGWKKSLQTIALDLYELLLRHRWAATQILAASAADEVRLGYMEYVLRTLRRAGLSARMTDHAYHALESHIFGYTLWVIGMDLGNQERVAALAEEFAKAVARGRYPYVIEHVEQHALPREPGEDFAFGLDLILDGLDRWTHGGIVAGEEGFEPSVS
jgi:AcrR family transcriptional regulator